jgi:hypothetical protein
MAGHGPLPIGRFVGPRSTRRGAQIAGETPTAQANPHFVAHIEPVIVAKT